MSKIQINTTLIVKTSSDTQWYPDDTQWYPTSQKLLYEIIKSENSVFFNGELTGRKFFENFDKSPVPKIIDEELTEKKFSPLTKKIADVIIMRASIELRESHMTGLKTL